MTAIQDVAREFTLLVRSLKSVHRAVLAEVGVRLELPAAAMLSALEDGGPMRLSALADVLILDLSSVSRQAAAVEREGWVSRQRDPVDSRAALVELTERGREVVQRLRTARGDVLRQRLAGWPDDELERFAGLLHRARVDLQRDDSTTHVSVPGTTDHSPALAGREA